eukprot:scpid13084/ scgid2648/ 
MAEDKLFVSVSCVIASFNRQDDSKPALSPFMISAMDCDLFKPEISIDDMLFYRQNARLFKEMWEHHQRGLFWLHFASSFFYHTVIATREPPPECLPLPERGESDSVNQIDLKKMRREALERFVSRLIALFAAPEKNFSEVRTLMKDCCTLREYDFMVKDILHHRSRDPFYHKSTRDVYRRLYGAPGISSAIDGTMMYPYYAAFAGAMVLLLRQWLSLSRTDIISPLHGACLVPGDIRGMCLVALLLNKEAALKDGSAKVEHLEAIICQHLLVDRSPPAAGIDLPENAAQISAIVEEALSPVPLPTGTRSRLPRAVAGICPSTKCRVCQDKRTLCTQVVGMRAGYDPLKRFACGLTRAEQFSCDGNCYDFGYRASQLVAFFHGFETNSFADNFIFRTKSLLVQTKPCNNYSVEVQMCDLFQLHRLLQIQVATFTDWDALTDVRPYIKRVWQLTQAFCELTCDSLCLVEAQMEAFCRACDEISLLGSKDRLEGPDEYSTFRHFLSSIPTAILGAVHVKLFARTSIIPQWSTTLSIPVLSMVLEHHKPILESASKSAYWMEDTASSTKLRQSCCAIAAVLKHTVSEVLDLLPLAYRMVAILQTTGMLLAQSESAVADIALIKEASQLSERELAPKILEQPEESAIAQTMTALAGVMHQVHKYNQQLAASTDTAAAAAQANSNPTGASQDTVASTESAPSESAATVITSGHVAFTMHTCSSHEQHEKHLAQRLAQQCNHEERRQSAKQKIESYGTTPDILLRASQHANKGSKTRTFDLQLKTEKDAAGVTQSPGSDSRTGEHATSSDTATSLAAAASKFAEASSQAPAPGWTADGDRRRQHQDHGVESATRANDEGDDAVSEETTLRRIVEMETAAQSSPRYVQEHELAEFDRAAKARRQDLDENDDAAEMRADRRPRVDYDELSRANFTFDGFNTLKNSPTCTAKDKHGAAGPGRVNIDVSLKRLNPAAYQARESFGLSEYVPLYSGHCSCTSPFCKKCINPLVAPDVVQFGYKDGLQVSKKRSSKSERARQKELNRLAKVKKKSSISGAQQAKQPLPVEKDKGSAKDLEKKVIRSENEIPQPAVSTLKEAPTDSTSQEQPSDAAPPTPVSLAADQADRPRSSPVDGKRVRTISDDSSAVQVGCHDHSIVRNCDSPADHELPMARSNCRLDVTEPGTAAPCSSMCSDSSDVYTTASNASAADQKNTDESARKDTANEILLTTGRHDSNHGDDDAGDNDDGANCDQDASSPSSSLSSSNMQTSSSDQTSRKQQQPPRLNTCSHCATVEPTRKAYKKCNRCTDPLTTRYYCSRACQASDWKARHRREHRDEVG